MSVVPLVSSAKAEFTKELNAVVNIMPPPSSYLLQDFKQQYSNTVFASWQKKMWGEQANQTVLATADGQLVKVPQFTEIVDMPPQQQVYFNINTLYSYNTAFGTINPSQSQIDTFMEDFTIQLQACKDRFTRTYSRWL